MRHKAISHRVGGLVAGVMLVTVGVACGDEDAGEPVAAGDGSDVTAVGSDEGAARLGKLAYFAPDPLPDDARVSVFPPSSLAEGADDGEAATSAGGGSSMVVGRPEADGFSGVVRVYAGLDPQGDPSTYDGVRPVDVNGVDAYLSDHAVTGSSVAWQMGSTVVGVVGPHGMSDVVVEVARALDVADDGSIQLEDLPKGYEEVASYAYQAETDEEQTPSWTLMVDTTTGDDLIQRSVQGSATTTDMPLSMVAIGDELVPATVRGAEAFLTAQAIPSPDPEQAETLEVRSVTWFERPGLALTVRISKLDTAASPEDLLAFAESLEEVDEDTFLALDPDRHEYLDPTTTG